MLSFFSSLRARLNWQLACQFFGANRLSYRIVSCSCHRNYYLYLYQNCQKVRYRPKLEAVKTTFFCFSGFWPSRRLKLFRRFNGYCCNKYLVRRLNSMVWGQSNICFQLRMIPLYCESKNSRSPILCHNFAKYWPNCNWCSRTLQKIWCYKVV